MAHPNLTSTTSSTVDAYGSVPGDTQVSPAILYVQFRTKKIYSYIVLPSVCEELELAASKGKYINQMKKLYTGNLVSDDFVSNSFALYANKKARNEAVHYPLDFALRFPVLSGLISNFF